MLTLSGNAFAQQDELPVVALTELGAFETKFTPIKLVNTTEGASVLGTVTYRPNTAFSVSLPFKLQQIIFTKVNGQSVKKGERIARISGVELNHFIEEYQSAKSFYLQAKKFLNNTKSYASDNTIKREEWLALNKTYLEASLALEHLSHVKQQLTKDRSGNYYLLSPEKGIINIFPTAVDSLFEVVPEQNILVKTMVSQANIERVAGFNVVDSECRLKADVIEPIVIKNKQNIWSQLNSECYFALGSQLVLRPIENVDGFSVPEAALFEIDNKDFLAVKDRQQLHLIEVDIVGSSDGNFVVQSSRIAENAQVLVSSVSAVQGIILGLGD